MTMINIPETVQQKIAPKKLTSKIIGRGTAVAKSSEIKQSPSFKDDQKKAKKLVGRNKLW